MNISYSVSLVLGTVITLAGANCFAVEPPLVGVLEYVPVTNDGPKVIARPTYIFTDRKISTPTVFSALVGTGTTLAVACCFEVKNTTPTSLTAELSKYGKDSYFVDRMKSVKGYRYIYLAQPTADKRRWTPLMADHARNAANPDDGTPFTSPVVAAQFDKPVISAAFAANGVPMTLQTRFNKKSDRITYTFARGGENVEFSEDGFAD
jgi:hypothetical protein